MEKPQRPTLSHPSPTINSLSHRSLFMYKGHCDPQIEHKEYIPNPSIYKGVGQSNSWKPHDFRRMEEGQLGRERYFEWLLQQRD